MLASLRAFLRRPGAARVALVLILTGVIGYSIFHVGRFFWAGAQLRTARQELATGHVRQARLHLLRCLQVRPDDPDVHLLLGRVARRVGAYKEAEDHLVAAKRLGAVPEETKLERLLQDVQRGAMGTAERQLWTYTEKDHPDTLDILEALGRGYLVTYRLGDARKALDRLLALQPAHAPAWVLRGKAVYFTRNYAEAEDNYRRAVALMPEDAEARRLLADCLIENAQPAEALEQYDRLAAQAPDDPAILLGRARCLLELGPADAARAAIDAVLQRAPGNVGAMILYGKLELRRAAPAAAESWLRQAVTLDPSDREAVHNLSVALQQQDGKEKKDEAAKWLKQFTLIEAEQARLSALTKQIVTAPHDPALRCQAGEIFLKIGNEKEGLRWLNSALTQAPHDLRAHRILRDYYRARGRTDLAESHARALAQP